MSASASALTAPPRALVAARVFLLLAAIGSFTSPPVANLGAVLALGCIAATPGLAARLRSLFSLGATRALVAFLGVMALSMLWADAPWGQRFAAWFSWRPLLLVLAGWIAWTGAASSQARFARALACFIALCALVSFVFWLVPSLPAAGDNERGVLLRNHVTQGMAMVAGVVLAALDWKASGARGAWRASLAAMIALMLANIALICVGRSAHVALLVASAALALLLSTPGRRWRALLVVPVAALVVLVSSPMVRERFAGGWNELGTVNTSATETSMGLRVVIWKTTLGIIRDHPLFGVGAGSFAPSYAARIHAEATGWQAAEAKDTHNQYLHVQVEAGALGSVAFIAMAWMLSRRRGASPWREGGVALLLAWLATSLFNSHFENFAEAHLIGVLLGLLLAPAAYADGIPGSASSRRAADSTSP